MTRTRIDCLDGLRGLAAIAVVLTHCRQTPGAELLASYPPMLGVLGMRCFFGLSGYLITRVLLGERETRGRNRPA